jgi:hypothetical protein
MFERPKTVLALDGAATETGWSQNFSSIIKTLFKDCLDSN